MRHSVTMLSVIFLSLFSRLAASSPQIISSCPPTGASEWNEDNVGANLRSWLQSVTTVRIADEDGVKSMRYFPETDEYGPHSDTENFSDTHDNPRDTGQSVEEGQELVDTDAEKGFVTIAHFKASRPRGLAWQWQSERILEGFLYGDLGDGGGRGFTGSDLLYIYPDLETGLRGRFEAGEAVAVRAVTVTSERCSQGVKEVRTRERGAATTWTRSLSNNTHISQHPLVVDPHEDRSVFIGDSTQV